MILGVMSLASFMWFLGIPALVLGIIGLKKHQENRGLSMTGLVTGIISTILMILGMMFLFVLIILAVLSADDTSGYQQSSPDRSDSYEYRYRDSTEKF